MGLRSDTAEFTEFETGPSKRQRVAIQQAIMAAKENDAVLLIAKLDRLARNVALVSALMESGVDFVAVDIPEANKLTIHIIAAIAARLNEEGLRNRTGKKFYPMTVQRVLDRVEARG